MSNIIRFTPRRKAQIVHAITEGHMSEVEARDKYALSPEELTVWLKNLAKHGLRGLLVRPRNKTEYGQQWHRNKP